MQGPLPGLVRRRRAEGELFIHGTGPQNMRAAADYLDKLPWFEGQPLREEAVRQQEALRAAGVIH